MGAVLMQLAIKELPSVVDALKEAFRRQAPDGPQPTSEQVVAAFLQAGAASLAKDDLWLAQHPQG